MVEREQDQDARTSGTDIPHQRPGEKTTQPNIELTDEELLTFLPRGRYDFERTQLEVTGKGIEEVGIHTTGQRIDAYILNKENNRAGLRGVLTGYRDNRSEVAINIVGILHGRDMNPTLYTTIPGFDLKKHARAVAQKGFPIALGTDKSTGGLVLASNNFGGLLSDLDHLENALRFFDVLERPRLHQVRKVANFARYYFKAEHPGDQPGGVNIRGK